MLGSGKSGSECLRVKEATWRKSVELMRVAIEQYSEARRFQRNRRERRFVRSGTFGSTRAGAVKAPPCQRLRCVRFWRRGSFDSLAAAGKKEDFRLEYTRSILRGLPTRRAERTGRRARKTGG